MKRNRFSDGFTLIEVVLALSLAVVVMAAIGTAIFLHLRAVDKTRVSVERDQLARTLMRRMSDDLRAAVRREPFDDSALKKMIQSAAQSKGGGGRSSGGGGSGQASGSSSADSGGNSSSTSNPSQSSTSPDSSGTGQSSSTAQSSSSGSSSGSDDGTDAASTQPAVAGVYGTAYDLQVDIARVPRPDEINEALALGRPTPGDVRTVYYFLASAATGQSLNGETGLMRAEVNRAEALYATENGDYDIFLRNGELLAMEVVGLEFRYFDGTQWLTEWSSQDTGGLPLAIEMAVVIADPVTPIEGVLSGSLFDPLASGIEPDLVYRTMVQLPNAQSSSSTSSGSSTSSSDDSSSSSSGSSSSGSGSSASSSSTSGGMQ